MSSNYNISHLFNVKDLVVVITGGGRGLGLIFANALDQNGAKAVYIVGRNEETLQQAAKNAVNGSLIPVAADIGDQASIKVLADRVKAVHGYVNAVIANAGIVCTGTPLALWSSLIPGPRSKIAVTASEFAESFMKAGMADFTNTMHVNTTGTFFTVLSFLDLLVEGNKKGNVTQKSQVIILTSAAGFARNFPGIGYATSKAALTYLSKSLSTMFGPYGVRVNNLAPGKLSTEEYQLNSYSMIQGYYPSDMSESGSAFLAGPGVDATQEGAVSKVSLTLLCPRQAVLLY
jgi:NAD(P)-dependent dehydrogenase (short-subunit alcohol dehydrogenase family)